MSLPLVSLYRQLPHRSLQPNVAIQQLHRHAQHSATLRNPVAWQRRAGIATAEKAISNGAHATESAKNSMPPLDILKSTVTSGPKRIVLPHPSLPAYKVASRVLPTNIAESFTVLYACIRSHDMDRATRVMVELYKNKPEEMKIFADNHIYNTFLEGFVEASPKPLTSQCLTWFDQMRKHNLTPDADTYAIVTRGFMKAAGFQTARAILQEMKKDTSFTMEQVLRSPYLKDGDEQLFLKLIEENRSNASRGVTEMLGELEAATKSVFNIEPTEQALEASHVLADAMSQVPEARSTNSTGVKFLQEHLATLEKSKKSGITDPYELQLRIEERAYEVALEKLNYEKQETLARGDKLGAMNLSPLKRIMWNWHQRLTPLIVEEVQRCDKSNDSDRRVYGPFLKLLPAEKLSVITILELMRLHGSSGVADGMKTARALIDVGRAVEMEWNAVLMKDRQSQQSRARNQETHALFSSGKLFNMALRRERMRLSHQNESSASALTTTDGETVTALDSGEWNPVWPSATRAKVGSVLTSLLIEAATIPTPSINPETGNKITEMIPAFFHTYQYVRGKRVGIIKFSPNLTEMLSKEPVRDTLHPRLLPMLVPPRPWLTWNSGGYLSTKSICMRIKDSPEQVLYLKRASEESYLDRVLTGLDVLGATRWKVNRPVFDVILQAWNSGDAIADIPPVTEGNLPLPEKPENYATDPKAKLDWIKKVKEIQNTERNHHSLRCDVNYKVETARAFLDTPMYFPHNMDFRGRAYPIPPTLNHLGNDLCRGLLQFDVAKPLGASGYRWLKIHLANLHGYDKHSFTERENYVMENLDHIFDSADNPLNGQRWWLQSEDPWQCLAACYEVSAAVRSGDPENFKSRLPIHQDGTCNGLQHYAALGGDLAGAQAVNLAPSDRPADVYTGVAEMVNKLVDLEAAEGHPDAVILQGKISRKIVKQTVMTNVYGVTFVGARQQIENRLKERSDIPSDQVYHLAGYLAKKVFASLGEMFNGARQIQDWLTDSARRIAKSIPEETIRAMDANIGEGFKADSNSELDQTAMEYTIEKIYATANKKKSFSARNPGANQMTSVVWTTPLGLPIVQPYRRVGKRQVSTLLQTVFIEDPDASCPVNSHKQSTAFPPNFIHSLDATHMLMSAVACQNAGLAFASVHDSYWTHAADVDTMNKIIRDQFIELHKQPIMESLRTEFIERYQGYKVPVSREVPRATKKSAKEEAEKLLSPEKAHKEVLSMGFASEDVVRKELEDMKKSEGNELAAVFGTVNDEEDADDDDDEDPDAASAAARRGKKYAHSWEDLTFMPLPAKGEFDIQQVKESDYFFH
ncbi:hypothetical protein K450DRAFT_244823 [Umbelopsis ramanniana AG]|uniref:DNA-directed RNA polymerase n=1 Tax=Umbelopsis ramanniana AG TaxID=1314678 RepID=A0AAD5HC95_UMBRA|nr:uncharacterized protein K450DRAFT_244823 [Umbelopsis ramanniana AG]KAI8578852.1 hypothetical protein K450DRAFT_244823 [Umbelopsis ramanniana AG]